MPVGITGISIPLLLIVTQAIPWVKTGNTLTPPLATVFAGFTTDVIWLCLFAFMVGGMMQLMKLDRRIAMVISIRSAWKSRSFIRLERGDEGKRT
jgi:solute carrier family 13 (sodium-dependent dicarboxylate transporter), member 2/3/5